MPDISNLISRLWAWAISVSNSETKLIIKPKPKTSYKPCATKRKLTKKK